MRLLPALLFFVSLTGCMSRPGMVDCTTNRAYPAFSKPLCGGPFDPFIWVTGDCNCCCAGAMKCAYTPYGGRTCCGEEMKYVPGCTAPPLRWAAPAMPTPPGGHAVHLPADCPPPLSPAKAAKPASKKAVPPTPAPPAPADGGRESEGPGAPAPPLAPPAEPDAETPAAEEAATEWHKPEILRDARVEPRDSSRL